MTLKCARKKGWQKEFNRLSLLVRECETFSALVSLGKKHSTSQKIFHLKSVKFLFNATTQQSEEHGESVVIFQSAPSRLTQSHLL